MYGDTDSICRHDRGYKQKKRSYKTTSEDADKGRRTNIYAAAFKTWQARLELYKSLEVPGDRVLYYDIDSMIYSCKPGQSEIPLGDYLGDMINELDDNNYITEFVSGRAKNYGYHTKHGKVCYKVSNTKVRKAQ